MEFGLRRAMLSRPTITRLSLPSRESDMSRGTGPAPLTRAKRPGLLHLEIGHQFHEALRFIIEFLGGG